MENSARLPVSFAGIKLTAFHFKLVDVRMDRPAAITGTAPYGMAVVEVRIFNLHPGICCPGGCFRKNSAAVVCVKIGEIHVVNGYRAAFCNDGSVFSAALNALDVEDQVFDCKSRCRRPARRGDHGVGIVGVAADGGTGFVCINRLVCISALCRRSKGDVIPRRNDNRIRRRQQIIHQHLDRGGLCRGKAYRPVFDIIDRAADRGIAMLSTRRINDLADISVVAEDDLIGRARTRS